MVKLAKVKLSKIHKRVLGILPASTSNGRHYFAVDEKPQPVSTRPFHQEMRQPSLNTRVRHNKLPEDKHVVFMGVNAVQSYNTKDAAVISMSYEDVDFPEAKEVLRLKYEPGEITREQCDEVVAFIRRNKDTNFVAHCTYGEQRSRGVAHAIAEILMFMNGDNVEVYRHHLGLWTDDGGRLNEGDVMSYKRIYHAYRMHRRAENPPAIDNHSEQTVVSTAE